MTSFGVRFFLALLLTTGCLSSDAEGRTATAGIDQPPTPPTLSRDESEIYRSFLAGYSNGSGAVLNVADFTQTPVVPQKEAACIKGLRLLEPGATKQAKLNSGLLPVSGGMRLVDAGVQTKRQADPGELIRKGVPVEEAVRSGFAAGLLSLTAIRFDRDHRYAVFAYSFVCGALCGHGATLVYEKQGTGWVPSEQHQCGSWVS